MRIAILSLLPLLFFAACDTEQLYHRVEVVNGSGSGQYELGQKVAIEADPPPPGKAFLQWTGDTSVLASARQPLAAFSMPLHDLRLEATYSDQLSYSLNVENGSGSGKYLAGTLVTIEADPAPAYQVFFQWTGDIAHVSDVNSVSAMITMPDSAITVQAAYTFAPDLLSFSQEILPIFKLKCSISGCHDQNGLRSPLTSYDEIKDELLDVQIMVLNGTMPPPPDVLTQTKKDRILLWIEQGAPNN